MPKRRQSKRNSDLYDELSTSPPKRKYDPGTAESGECSYVCTDRADVPKDEEKKTLYMSPSMIRFAQDTISHKFEDGKGLDETLDSLKSGDITVESIPMITVIYVEKLDLYFTHDNRRLCVFQKYEKYLGEKFEIPVHIGRSEDLGRKRLTTKRRSCGQSVDIINEAFKTKDRKSGKKDEKLLETWICPKTKK